MEDQLATEIQEAGFSYVSVRDGFLLEHRVSFPGISVMLEGSNSA